MFKPGWLRDRGVTRGKPESSSRAIRRWIVLGLLAASSLLETGCQSGPFSPCGFVGRTTSRIMRPFRNRAACGEVGGCDGGLVSDVPVEYAAPAGTPIVTPAPTTIVPGPSIQSNGLPSAVEAPSALEPIPQATPGPGRGATRGSSGSKSPSSYNTLRPDYRSKSRNDNMAHTLVSTPVPATRSAQDGPTGGGEPAQAEGESSLDHIPPLDLPGEVTDKTETPPAAPPAERKTKTPATASDHTGGRSPAASNLTLAADEQPAPEPASAAGGVPGITRFAAVDLKLAGGSVPSAAGLAWLAEKGYKTLIDLRDPSEANPAFITEASNRGLRWIPLPIALKSIDRDHVARFNFELALSDARPLYFFDGDGSRTGALWYIRRITVDKVTPEVAHREAEDLGLSDPSFWNAAKSYLDALQDSTPHASAANPTARINEPAGASTPAPTQGKAFSPPAPTTPIQKPASQARMVRPTALAFSPPPPSYPVVAADRSSGNLRSIFAMILTGLSLPLAFLGRSVVPTILARTLASLPGQAQEPRSLLRSSGA